MLFQFLFSLIHLLFILYFIFDKFLECFQKSWSSLPTSHNFVIKPIFIFNIPDLFMDFLLGIESF